MSDRELEQLDLETAIDEQEEGFDGWDIFDDEDEQSDFLEQASGHSRHVLFLSPFGGDLSG